jgi:hypothetical protein
LFGAQPSPSALTTSALRVTQAARCRQRLAEAAQVGRRQGAAVVFRDLLRPDFTRVGREAAATEVRPDDRRIRAHIREAIAERHDLQVHTARRRGTAGAVVAVAAAAGCNHGEGGAGDRDLRQAHQTPMFHSLLFHVHFISSYVAFLPCDAGGAHRVGGVATAYRIFPGLRGV